jgi:hypothetical protein
MSHEIDFKNVEKKFTELGLPKGRGWFFITEKGYLLRLLL